MPHNIYLTSSNNTTPSYGDIKILTDSPSHPLLNPCDKPPSSDISEGWLNPYDEPPSNDTSEGWLPIPLRAYFAVPLLIFTALGPIVLEVLWYTNRKANGWPTSGRFSSGIFHYIYAFLPVAFTLIIAALWTWTDFEVKRLQPYVELFGNLGSPPHKSLLLDYTRTHNFLVWVKAIANKHHVVVLSTAIVLATLPLQPLAAALWTSQDTLWTENNVAVDNLAAIGLDINSQFQDLTIFLCSAGYVSATPMFRLGNPPFTMNGYSIGNFEVPIMPNVLNGSVSVNTSAVFTDPGCRAADSVNKHQRPNGMGWDNIATFGSCKFGWSVDNSSVNLFGADLATNCTEFSSKPDYLQPVIFWAFTYSPSAQASVVLCQPTISLWDVNVQMNLASQNVTGITRISPFIQGISNFSSFANNVTGPPLNGQAFNGIRFNLTSLTDSFVQQREQAIQFSLPAAIFQAMQISSPEGLFAALSNNSTMVGISSKLYQTYLALVALQAYFVRNTAPMPATVQYIQKRIWFTPVATHLLAADLAVLFFLGLAVRFLHVAERGDLKLRYEPGTIAAAVSMAGGTALGSVLADVQGEEELSARLRDKTFRMNPYTMKIIMEGDS